MYYWRDKHERGVMARRVASLTKLIAVGGATTASPGGPQACEARPHRGKAIIVSSAEGVPRLGRRSSLISCRRGRLEPVGSEPTPSAFSMKTPALLEQRRGVNHKPAFPPECSPDICHSSGFALAHKGRPRGEFPLSRQANPSPTPAVRR
jgi:hypothetical protein